MRKGVMETSKSKMPTPIDYASEHGTAEAGTSEPVYLHIATVPEFISLASEMATYAIAEE
jgi:hypothetical protein